jgi:hypothetical protein
VVLGPLERVQVPQDVPESGGSVVCGYQQAARLDRVDRVPSESRLWWRWP